MGTNHQQSQNLVVPGYAKKQRKTACPNTLSIKSTTNTNMCSVQIMTNEFEKQYLELEGILSNPTVGECREIALRIEGSRAF